MGTARQRRERATARGGRKDGVQRRAPGLDDDQAAERARQVERDRAQAIESGVFERARGRALERGRGRVRRGRAASGERTTRGDGGDEDGAAKGRRGASGDDVQTDYYE